QDQVLDPVDQVDVAVLVHVTDVAGVQAPAAQRLGGLLGPALVARHDLRAADADLAALADRQTPVRVVDRDDLDQGAGQRQADRAGTRRAERVDRAYRPGLGQAVALDQGAPREPLEGLLHLARQRRAAGDAKAQARQIVLLQELGAVD